MGTGGGPGQAVRSQFEQAVQAGLEKGATARGPNWSGWEFFGRHLAPYAVGPKEADFICTRLLNDPRGFRRELIQFLVSPEGRQVWEGASSERDFHHALRAQAGEELRQLLDAIEAYETFSRLCHDAFQDCLREMTRQGGKKTSLSVLAALGSVRLAADRVPSSFAQVMEKLEAIGEAARFRGTFVGLAERGSSTEWVEHLIEHHRKTQRHKPPNGKNPWFERFDDGSLIIRPDYRTDDGGAHDQSYAHLYRTQSLWQFALDLKLIKPVEP